MVWVLSSNNGSLLYSTVTSTPLSFLSKKPTTFHNGHIGNKQNQSGLLEFKMAD